MLSEYYSFSNLKMPERNLRFQQKLWHIVNCCKTGAVSWSNSGDSVIFKFAQFKREYLDRNVNFCKSNKIASFVRQLNLYGFRKLVKTSATKRRVIDEHEFQNMYFRRDRKDLLEHVIRCSSTPVPSSRKPRRRGRKIRHEALVKNDADRCYRKFLEKRNIKMSKVNKENELYPAEKFSFNSLWNSQKNVCKENKKKIPIYKMTNLLPATARLVLGDRGNTWQLQSNFLHQGIQKSFDYGIIKKENVKPGPAKMKTEMFKSKPKEQNFAYLDDDFSLDSEETNDAEEELYENVEESVDNCENYLNEHVVFNEKALSPNALSTSVKLNSRNVCEKSEEQMELEEAYTRVNGQTKHLLHCVCNSNVPPSWILSTFLR